MKILQIVIPVLLAAVGSAALFAWLQSPPAALEMRLPSKEAATQQAAMGKGEFTVGEGKPSTLAGAWPCFRGADHDNICVDPAPLAERWPAGGPRKLWSVDLGEGYAAPAIWSGRAYVLDYDATPGRKADVLRCLSLDDGKEIWHCSYKVEVLRNHGMSRTVPAVNDKCVVTIGPKCHVLCLDPLRGNVRWTLDLVKEYGTRVPDWYAGQCPLLDGNRVILAPAGSALLLAVDAVSGQVIWQTPNPHNWKMSHSSVVPMDFAGRHTYVYMANEGVAGVDAADGKVLWETETAPGAATYWRFTPSAVPTPVVLPEGRIFLTGGYGNGSLMIQLTESGGRIAPTPKALFRLRPEEFSCEQQTPIFFQGYLYGIRVKPADELVCLDLSGRILWTSEPKRFGLGPVLIAGDPNGKGGGLLYAMNDSGVLTLVRAAPDKYQPLAEAKVLEGVESWGPLVIVAGRLFARDLTKMVCVDVARK